MKKRFGLIFIKSRIPVRNFFGGRIKIELKNGEFIEGEEKLAYAHPYGKKPFGREDYINKFFTLSKGLVTQQETERFLNLIQNLESLSPEEVCQLNVQADLPVISRSKGIF